MVSVNRLTSRFFDQGLKILARDGYAGLKLTSLCTSLGVSTGAFYHSFSSWRGYTDQFLEHWQQDRTDRLVEIASANPDPLQRLKTLQEMTLTLPHRAEAAIRVWSLADARVAIIQKSVDSKRYDVIFEAFQQIVGSADEAAHYSRTGMYLLIGFELAESFQSVESLNWSLEQLRLSASRHIRAP